MSKSMHQKPSTQKVLNGEVSSLVPIAIGRSGFVDVPDSIRGNETACEVFKMVSEHIKSIGVIKNVDVLQLTTYAILQAHFLDHFTEFGVADMTSPLLTALRNYSIMFGLDPMSRSKILLERDGDQDERAEKLRQRLSAAS